MVPTGRTKSNSLTAQQHSDVLTPFATAANFIEYDTKGKLQQTLILRHKLMWRALIEFDPKLSFKKKVLEAGLHLIFNEKNKGWNRSLPQSQGQEWASAMTEKIRIQARHINQAGLKQKPPDWLQALLHDGVDDLLKRPAKANDDEEGEDEDVDEDEDEDEENEEEEPGTKDACTDPEEEEPGSKEKLEPEPAKKPEDQPEPTYYFGYDFNTKAAWRADSETGKKDFSTECKVPMKATDSMAMLFKFDDEWVTIDALKVGTYNTQQKVLYETTRGPLWTGRTRKKENLSISRKKDRHPLLILSDPGGQILQVALKEFAADPIAALPDALQFLTKLAEDYCSGRIDKDDLILERDERIERRARLTHPSSATASKAPASSTASAPSATAAETATTTTGNLKKRPASALAASSSSSKAPRPAIPEPLETAPATPPPRKKGATATAPKAQSGITGPPMGTGEWLHEE
jgi:hypothetical protein